MVSTSLGGFLDQLHSRYNQVEFLSSDPLEYAHRYTDPWDQEVVALIGAVLAYGNVKQIRKSIEDLLSRMSLVSEGPAAFVRSLGDSRQVGRSKKVFEGFIHRFNVGRDLFQLLQLMERSWREYGSLGAHFLHYLPVGAKDIAPALNGLISEWRKWAGPAANQSSFSYLLTAPAEGSCCKRWCMFLRWMGRKDLLDLGLWTRDSALRKTFPEGKYLNANQLVIPLDTHTGRISQYLGLTRRKSLNWKAALEVTEALRACDPDDPTRYDFAISRLGILDLCQKKFRVEICKNCDLQGVCQLGRASV